VRTRKLFEHSAILMLKLGIRQKPGARERVCHFGASPNMYVLLGASVSWNTNSILAFSIRPILHNFSYTRFCCSHSQWPWGGVVNREPTRTGTWCNWGGVPLLSLTLFPFPSIDESSSTHNPLLHRGLTAEFLRNPVLNLYLNLGLSAPLTIAFYMPPSHTNQVKLYTFIRKLKLKIYGSFSVSCVFKFHPRSLHDSLNQYYVTIVFSLK